MERKDELPRLQRLTNILTLLQSKRLLTSTEIAKRFGISKRTAYRDIRALVDSGIPIHSVEGKGYTLVEGYHLPPVMFTEEEANALITAQNIILQNRDQSLVEHHTSAITKVKAVIRPQNKEKIELLEERVAFMKNFKRVNTSNSLVDIQRAITNFQLMEIQYVNAKQVKSKRIIEPLALYHTQENWILIAWCRSRQAHREFRLDRIKQLKISDVGFEKRDFKLIEYFQELIDLYHQTAGNLKDI